MGLDRQISVKITNMAFVCALMVVVIHVWCEAEKGGVCWWLHELSANGICRIAVPFFFMVSGYFLGRHIGEPNWYVTYPIRLLAFLMLGRGLAAIDGDRLKRWRWLVLAAAILGMGLHFVRLPWSTGFVKDWIAVAPILMAFVAWSDRFTRRLAVVASFLGATSMGVYLLHPLFTKGVGIAIRRIFTAPYGVVQVVADWSVSWLCALLATVVMLRFAKLARFVK